MRGRAATQPELDFTVHNSKTQEVEEEIKKKKFVVRKPELFNINLNNVIIPIIQCKIKIGNTLFGRLLEIGEKFPKFKSVLKKCNLEIDRKQEGIIYERLAGVCDRPKLC